MSVYIFQTNVISSVLVLFLFLFATLTYTKYVTVSGAVAIYHHGIICSAYNIFNYAAPLSAAVCKFYVYIYCNSIFSSCTCSNLVSIV